MWQMRQSHSSTCLRQVRTPRAQDDAHFRNRPVSSLSNLHNTSPAACQIHAAYHATAPDTTTSASHHNLPRPISPRRYNFRARPPTKRKMPRRASLGRVGRRIQQRAQKDEHRGSPPHHGYNIYCSSSFRLPRQHE